MMADDKRNDGVVFAHDGAVYGYIRLQEPTGPIAELTEAQARVARMVWRGKSNAEIAKALGISVHTVANHLSAIYRRLDVGCRHEVIERLSGQ